MNQRFRRVQLRTDRLCLDLSPDVGGAVTDLRLRGPDDRWWPLLRPAPAGEFAPEEAACFVLAPWCNRIPEGTLRLGGMTWTLASRGRGDDQGPLHGEAWRRAWTILDRGPQSVRLELDAREPEGRGWPWAYVARLRYAITEDGFEAEVTVANHSNGPMPASVGFHPYWQRVLWSDGDRPIVSAEVGSGEHCMTGELADSTLPDRLRAGSMLAQPLDHVLSGFGGAFSIWWPASGVRAEITCQGAKELVVYAPGDGGGQRPHFALEPQTGHGAGEGSTGAVLDPGGTLAVGMAVRLVVN